MQKKFIRPGKPHQRPSPVVEFEDYARAMTPIEQYRKHYALFQYWNAELIDALAPIGFNSKRAKHASSEALRELSTCLELLREEARVLAQRILTERADIDRQLQRETYSPSQLSLMRQTLEIQTRQIHRELYWRKVEDRIRAE